MTVSIHSQPVQVRHVSFSRHKYGVELLVDVAWISEMPTFAKTTEPYTLDFYDITLITSGRGSFWLDDKEYEVSPGQVLFTSPNQVRRWYVDDLQGICLFFPASFILAHFDDPLFLHKFRFFHTHHGPSALHLNQAQEKQLLMKLSQMHSEISELRYDSTVLLRAISSEVLIYLNRWYEQQHQGDYNKQIHPVVARFCDLLEQNFCRYHKVAEYAALLSVTPGHLNVLCQQSMGRNASEMISTRLFAEAARRLAHSNTDVETLSYVLGFASSSYFCRAFKRHKGTTPLQYRQSSRMLGASATTNSIELTPQ